MWYYNNKEYTDKEFSMYLLTSYMPLYFNKNQIRTLKSKYNLDDIAKLIGEKDFSFFSLYYLRDYFVAGSDNSNRNLAPMHLEIWNELTQMFTYDKFNKGEWIQPRGSAKSTVINKALSCWRHCYKKSRFTIVLGNKESDATQFIAGTKNMLKNKRIVNTFGVLIDTKKRVVNKQEIELTNNTKIQAYSWGSSVRGTTYSCEEGEFRPSIIILDDILSEDDILTDDSKQKVMNKFSKEVLEVGDKPVYRGKKQLKSASKFIVLGTPLAQDCFINQIKRDPSFKVFHRQVCNFDADEYFDNNKYWQEFRKLLFNPKDENSQETSKNYYLDNIDNMKFKTVWEKYNCLDLATTYFTSRLSFMQELMCDCESVGEQLINSIVTMPKEEIENRKFDITIMTIDQAATSNRRSDYTAISIGSKSNFLYYVRKGILKKFDSRTEFDLYIDCVIENLKENKDISHVVLEKNVFKGIDATRIEEGIANDEELRKRNIKVIEIYNTKNKDERISTIIPKINNGQIIFPQEDKDYCKQIKDFRGQKYTLHDDAIDSLEMLINNIDTLKTTNKITFLDRSCLF